MRAGLLYLCLVFVLSVLGFSCQRRTTKTKPAFDARELVIKVDGAVVSEFKETKTCRKPELIILPNADQDLLLINLQSAMHSRQKQEKIEVSLSVPIDASSGLPAPGEYLFYNDGKGYTCGTMAFSAFTDARTKARTDCHFRLTTLILRVEETTENGLAANLFMTAKQVAGCRRVLDKWEEIQLDNEGWVQLQASFAAPVYNQPKGQKRAII